MTKMTKMTNVILVLNAVLALAAYVSGNGRLLIPPQRSSLWRQPEFYRNRFVFRNYDDHTLNCGGYWKKTENNGRCGVCGDAWDIPEPRPNEAGGIYGRGIIGRTYSTDKRFIDSVVQLTSSMGGYFQFNICPNNNIRKVVTQECLDSYPLRIFSKDRSTSYGNRFFPNVNPGRAGVIELSLEVPVGMACTQCVLQWRWHGANNYGLCRNGRWGKGCGDQPEIVNCADIAILPDEMTDTQGTAGNKRPFSPRAPVSTSQNGGDKSTVRNITVITINHNTVEPSTTVTKGNAIVRQSANSGEVSNIDLSGKLNAVVSQSGNSGGSSNVDVSGIAITRESVNSDVSSNIDLSGNSVVRQLVNSEGSSSVVDLSGSASHSSSLNSATLNTATVQEILPPSSITNVAINTAEQIRNSESTFTSTTNEEVTPARQTVKVVTVTRDVTAPVSTNEGSSIGRVSSTTVARNDAVSETPVSTNGAGISASAGTSDSVSSTTVTRNVVISDSPVTSAGAGISSSVSSFDTSSDSLISGSVDSSTSSSSAAFNTQPSNSVELNNLTTITVTRQELVPSTTNVNMPSGVTTTSSDISSGTTSNLDMPFVATDDTTASSDSSIGNVQTTTGSASSATQSSGRSSSSKGQNITIVTITRTEKTSPATGITSPTQQTSDTVISDSEINELSNQIDNAGVTDIVETSPVIPEVSSSTNNITTITVIRETSVPTVSGISGESSVETTSGATSSQSASAVPMNNITITTVTREQLVPANTLNVDSSATIGTGVTSEIGLEGTLDTGTLSESSTTSSSPSVPTSSATGQNITTVTITRTVETSPTVSIVNDTQQSSNTALTDSEINELSAQIDNASFDAAIGTSSSTNSNIATSAGSSVSNDIGLTVTEPTSSSVQTSNPVSSIAGQNITIVTITRTVDTSDIGGTQQSSNTLSTDAEINGISGQIGADGSVASVDVFPLVPPVSLSTETVSTITNNRETVMPTVAVSETPDAGFVGTSSTSGPVFVETSSTQFDSETSGAVSVDTSAITSTSSPPNPLSIVPENNITITIIKETVITPANTSASVKQSSSADQLFEGKLEASNTTLTNETDLSNNTANDLIITITRETVQIPVNTSVSVDQSSNTDGGILVETTSDLSGPGVDSVNTSASSSSTAPFLPSTSSSTNNVTTITITRETLVPIVSETSGETNMTSQVSNTGSITTNIDTASSTESVTSQTRSPTVVVTRETVITPVNISLTPDQSANTNEGIKVEASNTQLTNDVASSTVLRNASEVASVLTNVTTITITRTVETPSQTGQSNNNLFDQTSLEGINIPVSMRTTVASSSEGTTTGVINNSATSSASATLETSTNNDELLLSKDVFEETTTGAAGQLTPTQPANVSPRSNTETIVVTRETIVPSTTVDASVSGPTAVSFDIPSFSNATTLSIDNPVRNITIVTVTRNITSPAISSGTNLSSEAGMSANATLEVDTPALTQDSEAFTSSSGSAHGSAQTTNVTTITVTRRIIVSNTNTSSDNTLSLEPGVSMSELTNQNTGQTDTFGSTFNASVVVDDEHNDTIRVSPIVTSNTATLNENSTSSLDLSFELPTVVQLSFNGSISDSSANELFTPPSTQTSATIGSIDLAATANVIDLGPTTIGPLVNSGSPSLVFNSSVSSTAEVSGSVVSEIADPSISFGFDSSTSTSETNATVFTNAPSTTSEFVANSLGAAFNLTEDATVSNRSDVFGIAIETINSNNTLRIGLGGASSSTVTVAERPVITLPGETGFNLQTVSNIDSANLTFGIEGERTSNVSENVSLNETNQLLFNQTVIESGNTGSSGQTITFIDIINTDNTGSAPAGVDQVEIPTSTHREPFVETISTIDSGITSQTSGENITITTIKVVSPGINGTFDTSSSIVEPSVLVPGFDSQSASMVTGDNIPMTTGDSTGFDAGIGLSSNASFGFSQNGSVDWETTTADRTLSTNTIELLVDALTELANIQKQRNATAQPLPFDSTESTPLFDGQAAIATDLTTRVQHLLDGAFTTATNNPVTAASDDVTTSNIANTDANSFTTVNMTIVHTTDTSNGSNAFLQNSLTNETDFTESAINTTAGWVQPIVDGFAPDTSGTSGMVNSVTDRSTPLADTSAVVFSSVLDTVPMEGMLLNTQDVASDGFNNEVQSIASSTTIGAPTNTGSSASFIDSSTVGASASIASSPNIDASTIVEGSSNFAPLDNTIVNTTIFVNGSSIGEIVPSTSTSISSITNTAAEISDLVAQVTSDSASSPLVTERITGQLIELTESLVNQSSVDIAFMTNVSQVDSIAASTISISSGSRLEDLAASNTISSIEGLVPESVGANRTVVNMTIVYTESNTSLPSPETTLPAILVPITTPIYPSATSLNTDVSMSSTTNNDVSMSSTITDTNQASSMEILAPETREFVIERPGGSGPAGTVVSRTKDAYTHQEWTNGGWMSPEIAFVADTRGAARVEKGVSGADGSSTLEPTTERVRSHVSSAQRDMIINSILNSLQSSINETGVMMPNMTSLGIDLAALKASGNDQIGAQSHTNTDGLQTDTNSAILKQVFASENQAKQNLTTVSVNMTVADLNIGTEANNTQINYTGSFVSTPMEKAVPIVSSRDITVDRTNNKLLESDTTTKDPGMAFTDSGNGRGLQTTPDTSINVATLFPLNNMPDVNFGANVGKVNRFSMGRIKPWRHV